MRRGRETGDGLRAKRAEAVKQGRRRKKGRQQLRREDCGKRGGGGAETAPDRESGKGR